MLDPRLLRQDPERVRRALARRGVDFDLNDFASKETQRKELTERAEALRHQRKETSRQIGEMKKSGQDASSTVAEAERTRQLLAEANGALHAFEEEYHEFLLGLPNLPDERVPDGKSEQENREVSRFGELPHFDWTPLDHVELGKDRGMDFDRAARLSGSRFVLLRGQLARLNRALTQFMLDMQIQEHGYEEVNVPVIVRRETLVGTGQLPKFEQDQFHVAGDEEMFLIPTSEVPLASLYKGEILESSDLPLKFVAHSLCFRREAGSYGKDTRGMIRMHQFEKVELVQIVTPEGSWDALEELTGHAEAVLKRLELPFRRVELCTGDLGFCAARTYDLEAWLPSQNRYREISSCSNCLDFQARRMGCRMRDAAPSEASGKASKASKAKLRPPHTLNGSGLAIGRSLIAVMENYQDEQGNITVPDALRPYLGGEETIRLEKV